MSHIWAQLVNDCSTACSLDTSFNVSLHGLLAFCLFHWVDIENLAKVQLSVTLSYPQCIFPQFVRFLYLPFSLELFRLR